MAQGLAQGLVQRSGGQAAGPARPGARVLCLVVELCGLTFRANDPSKSNVIAAALFGDGAAAALLEASGADNPDGARSEERRVGKACVRTCRSRRRRAP